MNCNPEFKDIAVEVSSFFWPEQLAENDQSSVLFQRDGLEF